MLQQQEETSTIHLRALVGGPLPGSSPHGCWLLLCQPGGVSPGKSGIILLCNTITYSPHLCLILLVRSKSHFRPHSEEITTHRHQHQEGGSWGRAILESLCHKALEVFEPLQVYGSQSLPHIKATSTTTPFEIAPPDPGESHSVGDETHLGSGQ